MQEIKLSKRGKVNKGQVTQISDWRFDFLNQWKWRAMWSSHTKSYYAVRDDYSTGKKITILMHRLILNLPKGIDVDHKDGNTLNNQDDNLRPDPEKRNQQNARIRSDNTSGYKGVYWNKLANKWQAYVNFKGKRYNLGYFTIKENAKKARDNKALELHGEFSKLND